MMVPLVRAIAEAHLTTIGKVDTARTEAAAAFVCAELTTMQPLFRFATRVLLGCLEVSAILRYGTIFSRLAIARRQALLAVLRAVPGPTRSFADLVLSLVLIAAYDNDATLVEEGVETEAYKRTIAFYNSGAVYG